MNTVHNEGAHILPKTGLIIAGWTAGTTYDNVLTTTDAICRTGYNSAQVVLSHKSSLTSNDGIKATVLISESEDNQTYNAATTILATTTIAGANNATATYYAYPINIDLAGYGAYVKFGVQFDLTKSGTDTTAANVLVNLIGAERLPAA